MKFVKRLLWLVGIAIVIFCVVGIVAAAGVGYLIYKRVDLLHTPLVAWISGNTSEDSDGNLTSSGAPTPVHYVAHRNQVTDNGNYKTENNWIAAQVATEIADSAWLIVHPGQPLPNLHVAATVDPHQNTVHLELTGWTGTTVVSDLKPIHAWDVKEYAKFAQQLLGDHKADEPPDAAAEDYAADLLTPTGATLGKADVALSAALQKSPASVTLHEDAALLLLTLALRENADRLSDSRIEMNRACAHLAVVRALGGGADASSWTGRVANAALTTLTGREVDALPQLAAMSGTYGIPPSAATWVDVLTVVNKADWRAVTPDKSSPLLLRIVWLQTLTQDLGSTLALSYLDSLGDPEPVPDWGRAFFSMDEEPPVELGHRFCAAGIGLEFAELKAILTAEGAPLDEHTHLSSVFKDPVGHSITANADGTNKVRVVGLDLFEDISARHLVATAWATHFWMADSWGVPDEDAKFCDQMRALFKGARYEQYLLPYLAAKDSSVHLSPGVLHTDVAEIPPDMAMCSDWAESDCDRLLPYFGWGIPIGAPYDLAHRPLVPLNARLTHHHPDPKAPTFRSMIPLNPDSYWATSWTFLYNDDIHMPNNLADEKTLLAHFFDYNGNALYYFLQRADELGGIDDATREDLLRKQAALDPDDYYKLGDFLMSRGKADDAADAYRKGAQQGNDAVLFANSIKPLVKYDFEHNQQDEAMTMAKKAADVYSYGGLDTYAWLLCKLNRGPEAVDIEKQIQQRYGGDPLPEFYVAHPDLFPKESAAVIQRYYPNGLPTVTLADFTAPPIDGDRFDTESPETKRAGLQAGDVVVALDAHPVHSGAEYALIRAMSDSPELDLIVWRSGKYFEIKASPPERSFHIKASTYRAP